MSGLADNRCEACHPGAPTVSAEELAAYQTEVPEWRIMVRDGIRQLERIYKFRNFVDALAFTVKVGTLAEKEAHHPDIVTAWGKVTVIWWSHKIKDLHRNDFVMAAKTDRLYGSDPQFIP